MVQNTTATRSLTVEGDTVLVKSEFSSPPVPEANSSNADKDMDNTRSRKWRRQSARQYVDLDSEEDAPEQPIKVEDLGEGSSNGAHQPVTHSKKAHPGFYQETCLRYKTDSKILTDPTRAPKENLPELYKRSVDLNLLMKQKYEEVHDKLVEVKRARAAANKKVISQKKILTETKDVLQKANVRAEAAENNFRDANLQLTLKVARPLSQAQVKLENVQEDYANEMTHLHALLAQKEADRITAEEARIAAEAKLQELRETGNSQTPDAMQSTSDLQTKLDDVQRLYENSDSLALELAAVNTQLEADMKEFEAKLNDLKNDIVTAQGMFATEKAFLLGENEKLKVENQKLEQRILKQKAALDSMTSAL